MFFLKLNIIASICRFILYIFGWRDIQSKSKASELKKLVMIYPHSSLFDFIFFVLYSTGYPEQFQFSNFYVLMSERYSWMFFASPSVIPTPDKYVRYLMEERNLTYNQAIFQILKNGLMKVLFPKSLEYRLECFEGKKKYNFVKNICDRLSVDPNFILLISPTGSLTELSWKSGYRYIAETLDCKIGTAGINYEQRTCQIFSPKHFKEASESDLKNEFEIVGRKDNCGIIDWPTFSTFLGSCLLIPGMFEISDMVGLSSLFMSIVSFIYHYTHETCCVKLDLFSALSFMAYIFYFKSVSCGVISVLNCLLFCFSCFFLGRSWNSTRPRTNNYELNHSLFHVFTALAVSMMIQT